MFWASCTLCGHLFIAQWSGLQAGNNDCTGPGFLPCCCSQVLLVVDLVVVQVGPEKLEGCMKRAFPSIVHRALCKQDLLFCQLPARFHHKAKLREVEIHIMVLQVALQLSVQRPWRDGKTSAKFNPFGTSPCNKLLTTYGVGGTKHSVTPRAQPVYLAL